MNLSPHFTLDEFVRSAKASALNIDNDAPIDVYPALKNTAAGMERVRELLGEPITVSSGYRCKALNDALGSKDTSQHRTGEACDFVCPDFGQPHEIVAYLIDQGLDFDQIIEETSKSGARWVHISFRMDGNNRGQALVIDANGTRKYEA